MQRISYRINDVPEVGLNDTDTYQILVAFQRSLGDDSEYARSARGLVAQFTRELDGVMRVEGQPAGSFVVLSITVPPDVQENDPAAPEPPVFATMAEAQAFKAGIEYVNDSAIKHVEVHPHGEQWAVLVTDTDTTDRD